MTTHLPADPERGVCGHKHHGRISDQPTCAYCLHLTQHGPGTPRSGIDLSLYEMGNHKGEAYRAV